MSSRDERPSDVAERYADLVAHCAGAARAARPGAPCRVRRRPAARLMTAAETELVAAPVVRRITTAPSPLPPPSRRRSRRPGHRRRVRRHGRGRLRGPAGPAALPDQARHRAGRQRDPLRPGRPGRRPARRRQHASRRGLGPARPARHQPRPGHQHAERLPELGRRPAPTSCFAPTRPMPAAPTSPRVRSFTASAMDQLAALAASADPASTSALSDAGRHARRRSTSRRARCAPRAAQVPRSPRRRRSPRPPGRVGRQPAGPSDLAGRRRRSPPSGPRRRRTPPPCGPAPRSPRSRASARPPRGRPTTSAPRPPAAPAAPAPPRRLRCRSLGPGHAAAQHGHLHRPAGALDHRRGRSTVTGLVDGVTGSLGADAGGGAAGQAVSGLGKARRRGDHRCHRRRSSWPPGLNALDPAPSRTGAPLAPGGPSCAAGRRRSEEDRAALHQQRVQRLLDRLAHLVGEVEDQHRVVGRAGVVARRCGSARRTR